MKLTPINPNFSACDQQWDLMPPKANSFKLCAKYGDEQVMLSHRYAKQKKCQGRLLWLLVLAIGASSLLPFSLAAQDSLTLNIPVLSVSIPGTSIQVPLLKDEQHKIIIQGRVTAKNGFNGIKRPTVYIYGSSKYCIGSNDRYFALELKEEELASFPRHIKLSVLGGERFKPKVVYVKLDKNNQPRVLNVKLASKKEVIIYTGRFL